jgi:hypothetical protein
LNERGQFFGNSAGRQIVFLFQGFMPLLVRHVLCFGGPQRWRDHRFPVCLRDNFFQVFPIFLSMSSVSPLVVSVLKR